MRNNLKTIFQGDNLSILANTTAFIKETYPNLNWVGFYLIKKNKLILGPFQGKPAIHTIKKGLGVCGIVMENPKITIVNDVSKCDNHLVCDINSKSEMVIPVFKKNKLYALLDIDSPIINRFTNLDQEKLQEIVLMLENSLT